MKATLPNLKKLAGAGRLVHPAGSEDNQHEDIGQTDQAAAEPKPPPQLSLFFMLSHLEEDGPVRLDGVKLAVLEVMGLELDEPKLGAFAGALNALDFPVQLLVRQHPPVLQQLRATLAEAQPSDLPDQTRGAAESLGRLLTGLESREGILDRRFYAICEHSRADELRGLLSRAGLGVFTLTGQALRLLLLASALGGSPNERDEDAELEVEINRRDIRVGAHLTRSLHLGKWPRLLAPGFLQGLMAAGAPMDLSVHLGAIPSEQAARTLEWQKVRFESAQSLSLNRGRSLSPEAEIALEDVSRLRDEVQRGRERLFHASLSVTLHADNAETLKDLTQKAQPADHPAVVAGRPTHLPLPAGPPGPGRRAGAGPPAAQGQGATPGVGGLGKAMPRPALLILHPLLAVPSVPVATAVAVRFTLRARRVSFWPVFPGSRVNHPISGSNRRSSRPHWFWNGRSMTKGPARVPTERRFVRNQEAAQTEESQVRRAGAAHRQD